MTRIRTWKDWALWPLREVFGVERPVSSLEEHPVEKSLRLHITRLRLQWERQALDPVRHLSETAKYFHLAKHRSPYARSKGLAMDGKFFATGESAPLVMIGSYMAAVPPPAPASVVEGAIRLDLVWMAKAAKAANCYDIWLSEILRNPRLKELVIEALGEGSIPAYIEPACGGPSPR